MKSASERLKLQSNKQSVEKISSYVLLFTLYNSLNTFVEMRKSEHQSKKEQFLKVSFVAQIVLPINLKRKLYEFTVTKKLVGAFF